MSNIKIRWKETLIYYDLPIIFIGESESHDLYLCELTEAEDELQYFCVRITKDELVNIENGIICLRDVYLAHKQESYNCIIEFYADYKNELVYVPENEINEDWYPGEKSFCAIDKNWKAGCDGQL